MASFQSDISIVLGMAGLHNYVEAFTSYGVEKVSDIDDFSDADLRKEFNMNAVHVKKFRHAVEDFHMNSSQNVVKAQRDEVSKQQQSQNLNIIRNNVGGVSENGYSSQPPQQAPKEAGDERVQIFLDMCGLGHCYAKFTGFGVRSINDLFDRDLIGDEDLMCEIGMNMDEVNKFRSAVSDQTEGMNGARPKPQSSSNESAVALDSIMPKASQPRPAVPPPPSSSRPASAKQRPPGPPPSAAPVAPTPPPEPVRPSSAEVEAKRKAKLAKALEKVAESERPKVEVLVNAALEDLRVDANHLIDVHSKPKPYSQRSWAEGVAYLRALRTSPQLICGKAAASPGASVTAGGLALQQVIDVVISEIMACDRVRWHQLDFNDMTLLGHEQESTYLLQTFLSGTMKAAAGAKFIQNRSALINARIEAQSADAALKKLTASIKAQREAGDLDAALLGQAQLVGYYEKSISVTKDGFTNCLNMLKCITELAGVLAKMSGGDMTEIEKEEAGGADSSRMLNAMKGMGGGKSGGGFAGLAAAAAKSATANKGIMDAETALANQKNNSLEAALKRLRIFTDQVDTMFMKSREKIEKNKNDVDEDILVLEARRRDVEARTERLDLGLEDDIDKEGDGSAMSWITKAVAEDREKVAQLEDEERQRSEKRLTAYAENMQALNEAAAAGDKIAFLELQSKQARLLSTELDTEARELNDRRRQASVAAHRADETKKSILQARENKKVASVLILDNIDHRIEALKATNQVFELTLTLLLVLEKRARWIASIFESRFTHIERVVRKEMNKVLLEHMSVASDFVTYMSTLVGRKERDLDHLAARLLEHGRQRIDAIERDNADDVRRADRDKEETLKGQQVARRNLDHVRAQKTRALSDLVGCLLQVGNRPLGLKLEQAARDAYDLARKEAQSDNGESIESKSIAAALDDIDIQGGGSETEEEDSEYSHAGQRLEAAFLIPEVIIQEETEEDIGFGRGVSGVPSAPEPPVPVPEPPTPPPMQEEFDYDQDQGYMAPSAASVNASNDTSSNRPRRKSISVNAEPAINDMPAEGQGEDGDENETVYVQMVVPADAAPGSYLQASVQQDGQDYHFSVVVPPGAVPGETVLTVPVPIPRGGEQQQQPQQQPQERESTGGVDVIASFLMDRGIEAGLAIQAAMGLDGVGINTARKLQSGNIGDIARASGLGGDDIRRVFDNRNPQEVDSALAGMRGSRRASTGTNGAMYEQYQQDEVVRRGSLGQGGTRHKTYSIDMMDEEPLVRRGNN